ncbi:Hypothetical predicted protein [Paramuricea clavata]|uniref:Reverse transcriptase domain-containing protein n=1 Tax=Paramuricea clavata TaxID=317549 RepID=A0A7D9HVG7_PARCT|nr:Hypothetical predicted protein [Paramuricea clavata]
MNEQTDSNINQQPSILQAIDTPTNSRMRAKKIHMSSNRMQSNSSDEHSYVFVVTPPVENEISPNPQAVKTIPVIIERAHVKMIVEIPKNHQPDSPIMSKFKKECPRGFNGIGKLKGHEGHLHLLYQILLLHPNNPAEVRVCIDMRHMNSMIEREGHVIPNIEELFEDMAGATMFSKVDLTAAFHQLLLDEKSQSLTTFHTHKGLMQYKRLCVGVNSAPEQFQYVIQQTLH